MKINIRPDMLIGDLQREFNRVFPYLKLEFYRNAADVKSGTMMSAKQRVGDGQREITDSLLEILPYMPVKELEKKFRDQFTLSAQVFRKSGNIWLQTTITDDWTLEHQNEHGREISDGTKLAGEDAIDYDLERDAFT